MTFFYIFLGSILGALAVLATREQPAPRVVTLAKDVPLEVNVATAYRRGSHRGQSN